MSFILIVAASKTIRSLNPEIKLGGTFNLKHIILDRLIGYNLRDLKSEPHPESTTNNTVLKGPDGKIYIFKPDSSMGRLTITGKAIKQIMESGVLKFLTGFGPGTMIRSPHVGRSKKTPYEYFGIFGHYTGFVVYLLQTGIGGISLLLLFFYILFKKVYRIYKGSEDMAAKMTALGFLGATFVFSLDFFTYSQTTLNHHALISVYLYAATLLLRGFPTQIFFSRINRRI